MEFQNFSTRILVDQTPAEVYAAIINPRAWWQGKFEGKTDELNAEFIYKMGDIHYSKQKVTELIPGQKVMCDVTDSNLSFVDLKTEWTGTKIVFEIAENNNQTLMRFTHFGLVPQFQCYEGCSNAWEQLIQKSLLSLITTGKGVEVF